MGWIVNLYLRIGAISVPYRSAINSPALVRPCLPKVSRFLFTSILVNLPGPKDNERHWLPGKTLCRIRYLVVSPDFRQSIQVTQDHVGTEGIVRHQTRISSQPRLRRPLCLRVRFVGEHGITTISPTAKYGDIRALLFINSNKTLVIDVNTTSRRQLSCHWPAAYSNQYRIEHF